MFTEIKKYPAGWVIFSSYFSKKDVRRLVGIIGKIGMSRSLKDEKILPKIRLPKDDWHQIKRVFRGKTSIIDFSYVPKKKLFSAVWKDKNLTGEEFCSLILSNQ